MNPTLKENLRLYHGSPRNHEYPNLDTMVTVKNEGILSLWCMMPLSNTKIPVRKIFPAIKAIVRAIEPEVAFSKPYCSHYDLHSLEKDLYVDVILPRLGDCYSIYIGSKNILGLERRTTNNQPPIIDLP